MATMRKWFAACAAALLFFAGGTAVATIREVTVSSWNDLRIKVAEAAAGDTLKVRLNVAGGYTALYPNGAAAIEIDKPLTILCETPILVDRKSVYGDSAFYVDTASPVTISGFHFRGADPTNAARFESCIRATTSDLTVRDCTFENWQGHYYTDGDADGDEAGRNTQAGAVTAHGTKLTLDGCTFKGCSIVNHAIAVGRRSNCAGAVTSLCSETLVKNCSFIDNEAVDSDGYIAAGALCARGGSDCHLMIADSTFAGNSDRALYTWINTTILGSTFVSSEIYAFEFRPLDKSQRLRMANDVFLGNGPGPYDFMAFTGTESQMLLRNSVVGFCSPQVSRVDAYVAGRDNWTQWLLNVENGLPQPSVTTVNGVDRYAYPLSEYAYETGHNLSVPLLYDGNEANPTVYTGLDMKNANLLWYGDTTGAPTLHTQGVDGKECYYEIEEMYYFSCGSAMSYPARFNFEKPDGTLVRQQKVMWNYGTLTMPSYAAPTGYKFLGWDGKYGSGETVEVACLQDDGYEFSGDVPNALTANNQPIAYSIEYHGFNAPFDPQYHAYQTKVEYELGWIEKSTEVPVYGGLLNCTNEAARIAAYDQGCLGYTVKGWATSQERAQAGIVDYPLGQMLGSMRGGVDLTTEDGAVVKLWIVRTPNVGCGRFYKDSAAFYRGVDQCVAGVDYIEVPAMTGQDFAFPECPFTPPPGYQFKCWSQGADLTFGETTVWKNGDENFGNVYVLDGLVCYYTWVGQFYAEWKQSAGYTISYYANGGTGGGMQLVSRGVDGYEDLKILEPGDKNISRDGYTFMGWSLTSGDNNPIDYLPGRTAWGLTKGSEIALYAVWQIAQGSVRQATATDSTSGTMTYVYQVISAEAQTCRLLRVLSGTPISGSWTIPDMIHEEDGSNVYNWKVVACGEALAGDLRNVSELRFGHDLIEGLELLRNPVGLGNLMKFVGSSDAYRTLDGMLLNGEGTQLLAVPSGWNDENGSGVLEIPGTVTTIAANACAALKNVRTVIIPESVESIETDAFENNFGASFLEPGDGGIEQVYVRGNLMLSAIPDASMIFKETDWGAMACQPVIRYEDKVVIDFMPCDTFSGSTCAVVVPEGVTAIADGAFYGCAQMAAVSLPSTLEAIGKEAFAQSEYLTAVDIPQSVTNVGDGAFHATGLTSLTGGEGLIGEDFSVGVNIVGFTPLQAQADANGTAITFGVPGEGDWILVYQGNDGFSQPNLESGLVGIAGGAIVDFDDLNEAILPETVRWVGDYAFDGCSALRKITLCASTETSPSFAPLWRNSMKSCDVEVYGSATCDTIGSAFRVSLGDDMFSDMVVPFKLVIGKGIRNIKGAAFARTDTMDITLVTGGDDLVSVSRGAFAGTTWATLDEMSYMAPEPEFDEEGNPIESEWPSFTGYPHRNIGGFYVGYFGWESWIEMPETDPVTGEYITRLSPTAFDWAVDVNWIELVTLAPQLEAGQLTAEMFADADTTFQGLRIDESAPNYTTIDGVLYDKGVTKLLFFPRGFYGEFTVPSTLASIPQGAFRETQNLSGLEIPDDSVLTTIPAGCFEDSSVRSVVFGDNVAIIGEGAFANCSQLESITFGAGLVRIEDYAFAYVNSMLREIEFPKTLDTIGRGAFANDYLESVTFRGDAPKCAEDAFEGIYYCTAYVNPYSKGWNGDPTSTEFPEPAVWRGLTLERPWVENPFVSWAEYNGLTGDDAAWDAKPAKWGGQWENAFIYLFGEGIVDGSQPLMTIDIGADGMPLITTPKVVADEDFCPFGLSVVGTENVANWENAVDLIENATNPEDEETVPEGRKGWWLKEGDKANFFRVRLTN